MIRCRLSGCGKRIWGIPPTQGWVRVALATLPVGQCMAERNIPDNVQMRGYRTDLAYIHDAGFREYSLKAAPWMLATLRRQGVPDGLIVDLGSGSGRWAAELCRAGYDVLGIDQSQPMIDLARRIAPKARFRKGSLLKAALPACDGVTSIGECINYCFDESNRRETVRQLFARVHAALRPGGVFLFDTAEPKRLARPLPYQIWRKGRDWAILVSTDGDRDRNILRREMTFFRKDGNCYRRSEETHVLRLYAARDLIADLMDCGFTARRFSSFGGFQPPLGMAVVVAVKR